MRATIAVSLLLTAALPAAGQRPDPAASPWGVEAPGSLGNRFGLGFDLLLDRFDDLEATAGRQTVTFRGPDGVEETTVVPFDPRLDDRKHGRDWEERSVGLQVPIALPPLRFGRGLSIEPSLVLEAAAVDGRFTVDDLVEGRPDRHLDGTGARWGVGVQALGGLCRDCRWFWGAGYRFRTLSGLDLDEKAPREPGTLAVAQRTEIDSEAHHLTARLGASLAGGRAAVYVGVRGRRSDLVLDDQTTLASPERLEETTVATRLELAGEDTAAIAGVDFRLGRRAAARVEASFGGDGESVLFKVVRLITPRPAEPPVEPEPPPVDTQAGTDAPEPADKREETGEIPTKRSPTGSTEPGGEQTPSISERPPISEDQPGATAEGPDQDADDQATSDLQDPAEVDARLRSAEEIARRVAAATGPLLEWMTLEAGRLDRAAARGPIHPMAVLGFVDAVEPRLMDILSGADLEPLRAWFADYFRGLRRELSALIGEEKAHRERHTGEPTHELLFARLQPPPERDRGPRDRSRGILDDLIDQVQQLVKRADSRRLTTDLCVRSRPRRGALVELSAALPGSRFAFGQQSENPFRVIFRGLYAYRARLGKQSIACPAESDPAECGFLDLWLDDGPFLTCDFSLGVERCLLQVGDLGTCGQ